MRILFVGDVVGKPGMRAALSLIPALRQEHRADAVVVNCENAVNGKGVSPEIADELLRLGVDVLTGGNHIWRLREIDEYLELESRLLRPANYPKAPGSGVYETTLSCGVRFAVIHVEGRVFMRDLDCPFATLEAALKEVKSAQVVFVDCHAEATSEKQALAWHFDGRISALVGTHTHVQTADERVLPRGTAYLTDSGMTGPHDSVIGMDTRASIDGFLTQRFKGHRVASGNVILCGAIIDVDEKTGRARSIERIRVPFRE